MQHSLLSFYRLLNVAKMREEVKVMLVILAFVKHIFYKIGGMKKVGNKEKEGEIENLCCKRDSDAKSQ